MSHKDIIQTIIADFDLTKETEKRKAYQKCLEYADKYLIKSLDYTPFVAEAALLLNQRRINKSHIKGMVKVNGNEKIHLDYSDNIGPVLTGNRDGLTYLSKTMELLSESTFYGEHVHLRNDEYPMFYKSYPLTIYLEDEGWFDDLLKNGEGKADNKGESENQDNKKFVSRDIDLSQIKAFIIMTEVPPSIMLSKGKLYKALTVRKYNDDKLWRKDIREETDRSVVITLINDDNAQEEFAFDLDDPEIFFLTTRDLMQLTKEA